MKKAVKIEDKDCSNETRRIIFDTRTAMLLAYGGGELNDAYRKTHLYRTNNDRYFIYVQDRLFFVDDIHPVEDINEAIVIFNALQYKTMSYEAAFPTVRFEEA